MTADPLIELADRNVAVLLVALGLEPAHARRAQTVRPLSCGWCGGPIAIAHTGRPALFCSDAHRLRAWKAARER